MLLFDAPKRDLLGLGRRAVRAASARRPTATPAGRSSSLVGDDLQELAQRGRQARDLGRRRADSIERTSSGSSAARAETPPFALTDAWGARDVGGVLEAAEGAARARPHELRRASSPSSRSTSRGSARASALDGRGRVARARRPARLKMHPFAAEKAFGQAANFGDDELRAAVVRLAETRPGAQGRQPARRRARARARAGRDHAAGRGAGSRARLALGGSRPEASRAAWAFLRPAVFGGSRPWPRPGRSSGRARGAPLRPSPSSPSSTALSRRRVSVLTVER